jgi:plastocyanin
MWPSRIVRIWSEFTGAHRGAQRLIVAALLLTAASQTLSACGAGTAEHHLAADPQTYTVYLDVPPSLGHQGEIQVSEYFPRKLRVHPGDTVIWRNVGLSGHHTVTFGADRQVIPALYRVVGGASLATARLTVNEAVVWPCVASGVQVSPELSRCPNAVPEGNVTPTWDGTGYANSGVITRYFGNPLRNPDVRQFALHVSTSTEPGVYRYYDEIEQHMEGLLEVVPDATPTTSPAAVAARIPAEMNETVATIRAACGHEVASLRHGLNNVVVAGCGTVAGSYNDYFPDRPVIQSGETLTWINGSGAVGDYHTVTLMPIVSFEGAPFGTIPYVIPACGNAETTPPLKSLRCPGGGTVVTELDPAAAFSTLHAGATAEPGGTSGFFPAPYPATPTTTYSLRFNHAGRYQFGCVLHPGMTAEVIVR